MAEKNRTGRLLAGIDYREETPKVCCQTEEMTEPEVLPLDFTGQSGHRACFLRILSALKRFGRKEDIRASLILPELSEETIRQYAKEAGEAGFLEGQLKIMGEAESVVHFVMHQTNDIWQQQVWFLEFGREEIKATGIQVNKRTTPMVVHAQEPEFWKMGDTLEERDACLLKHVRERFGKKPVSAVFLAGTDLDAAVYKKSREEICFHRRVFLGDLIHARGACMAAGEPAGTGAYLFLGEQTLLYNVGIRSLQSGEEAFYTIVSAGVNWYEAEGSCEVLLLDEPLLEFSFRSMLGGEPIRAGMLLQDLPSRPGGTSRLLVEVCFPGAAECQVKVTDLGFGELYPSSELKWTESFMLKEEGENVHVAGMRLQV